MLLEPEGAGATGRRELSLCARSPSLLLTCGQASQAAIAAGNERNNLKELKKNQTCPSLSCEISSAYGTGVCWAVPSCSPAGGSSV